MTSPHTDYVDRPCPAVYINDAYMCAHEHARQPDSIAYVTWGGRRHTATPAFDLGHSLKNPSALPRHGLRRAIYDIAYGHVNGFPATAIAYYALTRSISERVWRWTYRAEQRRGHHPADMRMMPDGTFTNEPEERP